MSIRDQILDEMRVRSYIDVDFEIISRVQFIKRQLREANATTLVLGISGGVDSTVAGRLCRLAVDELNIEGDVVYKFIAMRLPYLVQADESDAQLALDFIKPTFSHNVDICDAVDELHWGVTSTLSSSGILSHPHPSYDFAKGNVKARMRMIAQYEMAGLTNGLVVGTDHSAESVTGFYTKHGDGACDLAPLFGLNKRQVRSIGEKLGAPERLFNKAPTADLEDNNPQLLDEDSLGLTYDQIDDFLEGKHVEPGVSNLIIDRFLLTYHKREMPTTP